MQTQGQKRSGRDVQKWEIQKKKGKQKQRYRFQKETVTVSEITASVINN